GDAESERPLHSYAAQLSEGVHRWQVIALSADGARLASPMWRFSAISEGLLGTLPAPRRALLYQPPFAARTLSEALALLAAACCGGLLIVIGAAWWLGARAQRRSW
ncbi:MAG: hypothetical protein ACK4P1_12990, partial [Aggregatilineales bacterium]